MLALWVWGAEQMYEFRPNTSPSWSRVRSGKLRDMSNVSNDDTVRRTRTNQVGRQKWALTLGNADSGNDGTRLQPWSRATVQ